MKVVVWVSEGTWEGCVDAARRLLAAGAEITLVHVAPGDVEGLAGGGPVNLLGRHLPRRPGPALAEISAEQAEAVLAAAEQRLGHPARLVARRGRVERELLEAAAGAEVLVLARDGAPGEGPRSIGPRARFVLDHAGCSVLLVPRSPPLPSA
jgi:nucleotide-binding universal stress UspA family protein